MAIPTKTCPDCAEEVRAAAKVCRFCGYRFEPLVAHGAAIDDRRASSEGHITDEASERRARWWDYVLLSGAWQFLAVMLVAYGSETVYEHPLPYLLDLLLVTAIATWIARRPYRGVLMWWRRAIPLLWALGLLGRTAEYQDAAAGLTHTLHIA